MAFISVLPILIAWRIGQKYMRQRPVSAKRVRHMERCVPQVLRRHAVEQLILHAYVDGLVKISFSRVAWSIIGLRSSAQCGAHIGVAVHLAILLDIHVPSFLGCQLLTAMAFASCSWNLSLQVRIVAAVYGWMHPLFPGKTAFRRIVCYVHNVYIFVYSTCRSSGRAHI